GAVTASQVLAMAFFEDGKWAQAFPAFGAERRGSPAMSFVRVDKKPILIRSQVYHPQYALVLDPTLLDAVNVCKGMECCGFVIVNTKHDIGEMHVVNKYTIDLDTIAMKVIGRKFVNLAMLGAFSAVSGAVSMKAISKAIRLRMGPKVAEKNTKAAKMAHNMVKKEVST
ncbi:MAG: 2-oxoacid:acceptor oxidoreductase family protein, partial [Candidatus Aenigmarchaeota archaeon]|nr:2-oxoacid:acceptor oxidoreductase family protein [Candidatus Aenigmarchaeota archaeon]